MEIKISDILLKYDTDKNRTHSYGAAYDQLFGSFDRLTPLNILEIGIQNGGSLLAWKEYFPNSKVTGVDIVDVVAEGNRHKDINYVVQDINDYRTDETFDLVIDDGSHWLKDAVHAVAYFSKKLNPGGIMVVEDVQQPETWLRAIGNILHPSLEYNKGIPFTVSTYDAREIKGSYDDFLIMIKNGH